MPAAAAQGKTPTGITGLDTLMGGGFVDGSINLVTGKTGTGKSIFSSQFLYNGIVKYREKGLYITTEETKENVIRQMKGFGFDFTELEKKGWLRLVEFEPFDIGTLTTKMIELLDSIDAKRVVIDSISMFELYMSEAFKIRKAIYKVLQKLRDMNRTVIVTDEILEESVGLSRFGVIEFMVDTVVMLQFLGLAKSKRSLIIRKMRMSDHSTDIHPFEITKTGIQVKSV